MPKLQIPKIDVRSVCSSYGGDTPFNMVCRTVNQREQVPKHRLGLAVGYYQAAWWVPCCCKRSVVAPESAVYMRARLHVSGHGTTLAGILQWWEERWIKGERAGAHPFTHSVI